MATFRTNMNRLSTETFQQLRDQTDLTDDQIREVMDRLGAFDDSTYQSTFELLGAEDATTKLGLLSGVLSSLPPDVQRQVTLAIIAGDPQAALDAVQASVSGAPAPTADLELNTAPAEDTAQGFANSEQPAATADLEADRKPADTTADAFAKTQRTADPVKVDANTAQAIATMLLLYAIARTLQPVVTVDARLGDYPTASEIASRIGVVRVPVDAYLRSEPRITGARD
jgi:hypothetical protein